MNDNHLQDWNSEIDNSSRARTYILCCSFGLNSYLKCVKNRKSLNLPYAVLKCQYIY